MAKYRQDVINEEIKNTLSLIFRDVKDYRVAGKFVSVTGVECAPDLSSARVYVSSLMGDSKSVIAGLNSAMGYIRSQLASRCRLRAVPELKFISDTSIQHGAHINSLLHKVEKDLIVEEEEEESSNE